MEIFGFVLLGTFWDNVKAQINTIDDACADVSLHIASLNQSLL